MSTSSAGAKRPVGQVPVTAGNVGLWRWYVRYTGVSPGAIGWVLAVGPQASPIPGPSQRFAPNTEWWKCDYSKLDASNVPGAASLTLVLHASPEDLEVITIANHLDQMLPPQATEGVVPTWKPEPPHPKNRPIFTLKDVTLPKGSTGHMGELPIEQISFTLDVTKESPRPTWYAKSKTIVSVLGDAEPVLGMVLRFEPVKEGDPGWPDPDWFWAGAEPV